jgi:hypothetical protein
LSNTPQRIFSKAKTKKKEKSIINMEVVPDFEAEANFSDSRSTLEMVFFPGGSSKFGRRAYFGYTVPLPITTQAACLLNA